MHVVFPKRLHSLGDMHLETVRFPAGYERLSQGKQSKLRTTLPEITRIQRAGRNEFKAASDPGRSIERSGQSRRRTEFRDAPLHAHPALPGTDPGALRGA